MDDILKNDNYLPQQLENDQSSAVSISIPETRKLSDCEKFIEGLKQLAYKCNMSKIEYNRMGVVIKYYFDDGTYVGCGRAHKEAGLIDYDK